MLKVIWEEGTSLFIAFLNEKIQEWSVQGAFLLSWPGRRASPRSHRQVSLPYMERARTLPEEDARRGSKLEFLCYTVNLDKPLLSFCHKRKNSSNSLGFLGSLSTATGVS